MPRASRLARQFEAFKSNTESRSSARLPVRRSVSGSGIVRPVSRPATLDDITLGTDERGIILGETGTGKSTLGEVLIDNWYNMDKKADIIILDTKPRFMAQWQLNGWSAKPLYTKWDYGAYVPNSVVIPLYKPDVEVGHAWRLGYRIIIAQIEERSDIHKLDSVLKAAYHRRRKGRHLRVYVDELNNFFRPGTGKAVGDGIIMVITAGRERSTSFLGAAQRPRWISVEAMESMTKLYWFHTPFKDDTKHLMSMGIPETAHCGPMPPPPGVPGPRVFYFFDKKTYKQGMCNVTPLNRGKKKGA